MNKNYGKLVQPNIKLLRKQFSEMCSLLGVNVLYRFPLKGKQYTTHGELKSNYSEPRIVSCIFEEHIDQKTAKKLGWDAELQENMHVISVPYDLENLQIGCLFEVPSAFDNTPGRLFRVVEMSGIQMYPASISCRLVQEYESDLSDADTELFTNSNFNLLREGD